MVEKKRIISLSFVLLCALLIAGCTGKSAGKYTYKLNNIQYWESLYVSQTTYYDDRVEIKLDGENSKSDFSFDSPDKKDAVTDRKNDTLVIYSDNPTDITSLSIHSSWYEAEFRYLNTDEYACIWRFWADDLGWVEYSGEDFFVYQEKTFTRFDEEAEKQKNRTREYFENLDKDSSLDKIVEDLGAYGIEGSGILYHVWMLNDGSEAKLVFDSKGKIARIYISGDEQSEVIYKREY